MNRERQAFRARAADWPPSVGELAQYLNAQVRGDASRRIHTLASLRSAQGDGLTFFDGVRGGGDLADCRAGCILLSAAHADRVQGTVLMHPHPRLAFARLTALYDRLPEPAAGISELASVHASAAVDASAAIGPYAVVEAGAVIAEGAVIGPGCVVGARSAVGAHSRLHANVTLYHDIELGQNAVIHSGTAIGGDGFGFVPDAQGYHKFFHLGGVKIGNDFECGTMTTIDRGALEDTVIGEGVKLDNQVHVAHNVRIGDHTAMAGKVGIGGGVVIGSWCAIGGGTVILGHLEIADRVFIESFSMVARSVKTPGTRLSGNWPAEAAKGWRRRQKKWRETDD